MSKRFTVGTAVALGLAMLLSAPPKGVAKSSGVSIVVGDSSSSHVIAIIDQALAEKYLLNPRYALTCKHSREVVAVPTPDGATREISVSRC
jgi:F0F1-type ATP synthase membrane subunit c/vacuolar-type H+-ATPase subunit K